MSEYEIKQLYKRVNERNKALMLKPLNIDYKIYYANSLQIAQIEQENLQFKQLMKNLKNPIPKGFLERLFVIEKNKNIIIKIREETAKQSIRMKIDEILELIECFYLGGEHCIKYQKILNYMSDNYQNYLLKLLNKGEISKEEYEAYLESFNEMFGNKEKAQELKEKILEMHKKYNKEFYTFRKEPTGISYKAIILDKDTLETLKKITIPKKSGLILTSDNIDIVKQEKTLRKQRNDKKTPILDLDELKAPHKRNFQTIGIYL